MAFVGDFSRFTVIQCGIANGILMSGVGRTGSQSTSDKGFPHKITRERSAHGYSCADRLFPARSRLLVAALLSTSLLCGYWTVYNQLEHDREKRDAHLNITDKEKEESYCCNEGSTTARQQSVDKNSVVLCSVVFFSWRCIDGYYLWNCTEDLEDFVRKSSEQRKRSEISGVILDFLLKRLVKRIEKTYDQVERRSWNHGEIRQTSKVLRGKWGESETGVFLCQVVTANRVLEQKE